MGCVRDLVLGPRAAQQMEGAFREGEAFLGGMLPSLAEELRRSMPDNLRRLFPPLDGGCACTTPCS